MFNKKLNAGKVVLLVFISVMIFALAMVFPALQAAQSVLYADTDALVDALDLPDVELHLKIIMRDNSRDADITILETDSVADMIYKSTTIPGLTPENIKLIYEESGIKWFLKNKLKLLQKVITERNGSEQRAIILLESSEIKDLLRDNSEIIKKHTGYTLKESDYESVDRFFKDNDKISQYMNSVTLQAKTPLLGNFKGNTALASVIAGILIAVFFIIGLLAAKNLTASFVSAGISIFFCGFISVIAGLSCRASVFLSRIDPYNLHGFLADTLESPLIICGAILAGIAFLCFIMAVIASKVLYAERADGEEEDDGSFSYEYITGAAGASKQDGPSEDDLPVPQYVPQEDKREDESQKSADAAGEAPKDESDYDDEEWKRYWIDPSDEETK